MFFFQVVDKTVRHFLLNICFLGFCVDPLLAERTKNITFKKKNVFLPELSVLPAEATGYCCFELSSFYDYEQNKELRLGGSVFQKMP